MDKYFYFVSELPFLQFGKEAGIKREDFLSEAKKWLTDKGISVLYKSNINEFSGYKSHLPSFLKDYMDFKYDIRKPIALWRKKKKSGEDYKLSGKVGEIISQGNPLEVEKKLLKWQWDFLDDKETGHAFDLEFLVSYFLKLQLLERLFSFDKEKGESKFRSLCEPRPLQGRGEIK